MSSAVRLLGEVGEQEGKLGLFLLGELGAVLLTEDLDALTVLACQPRDDLLDGLVVELRAPCGSPRCRPWT